MRQTETWKEKKKEKRVISERVRGTQERGESGAQKGEIRQRQDAVPRDPAHVAEICKCSGMTLMYTLLVLGICVAKLRAINTGV